MGVFMKMLIAILSLTASIQGKAQSLESKLCETLYPSVEAATCIKEVEYPSIPLINDYLEMAKISLKAGQVDLAEKFISTAQKKLIGEN
jgi:hypothetical protein